MNIFREFLHAFGYSAFTYKYPVRPRQGEDIRFWKNNVSHFGKNAHAKDIVTTDPRDNPLPVWVPHDGIIIALKQDSTRWGETNDFAKFMNYVIVSVSETELYMCVHIGKDSCKYEVGDKVKVGEQLATTGVNGWMTDVEHLHFVVAKMKGSDYESLKIRWDKDQEFAPAKK